MTQERIYWKQFLLLFFESINLYVKFFNSHLVIHKRRSKIALCSRTSEFSYCMINKSHRKIVFIENRKYAWHETFTLKLNPFLYYYQNGHKAVCQIHRLSIWNFILYDLLITFSIKKLFLLKAMKQLYRKIKLLFSVQCNER